MYKIELIKKVMDTDHNRAKLELESGNKIVKDCIGELRNIIFNLHPMSLDDLDTKSVFYDFIQKIKFYEKSIDKHYLKYYNKSCRKTNASYITNADVAELADAQDLKSCG